MMKSKKENIAEYILYLWQMEDYLRAFPQNADATPELHELNEMMHREGIMNGGHLALANNALNELEELHAQLLDEDAMYRASIIRLQPSGKNRPSYDERSRSLLHPALPDHVAPSSETSRFTRDRVSSATSDPTLAIPEQNLFK